MPAKLALVTYLVRHYDEAIAYFTDILGFALLEDTALTHSKRWVVVAPRGSQGAALLLAKAVGSQQEAAVGNQAGGRVGFFLHTDAFPEEYARMKGRGVDFCEEPRNEPYGMVAVFKDLYGNRWDLIQPKPR